MLHLRFQICRCTIRSVFCAGCIDRTIVACIATDDTIITMKQNEKRVFWISPLWLCSLVVLFAATLWTHFGFKDNNIVSFWATTRFSTAASNLWRTDYSPDLGIGKDRCTIQRIHEENMTYHQFLSEYWRQKPVILVRPLQTNRKAQRFTTKHHMMQSFASRSVPIAGVEAYAFREERTLQFSEYLSQLSSQEEVHTHTHAKNVTFNFGLDPYGVGDVYIVPHLLNDSAIPRAHDATAPSQHIDASWHFQLAIAGSGVGLPFHWHGDVFAEVLHGARRWFLAPPDHSPAFNPRTTSAQWLRDIYRPYWETSSYPDALLECTMRPNEALYVPADWFHSTLSLGEAVSITTSFAQQYRQERYVIRHSGAANHAFMLDAMERRDFPTAIEHAKQLTQTYRANSFVPYSWLGVLYTLQAPTLSSEADIRSALHMAVAATEQCIQLNPYYAPCYVWYSRQLMTLSYMLTDSSSPAEYQQRAVEAKQKAALLSSENDDELLDPRWQPKPKKR